MTNADVAASFDIVFDGRWAPPRPLVDVALPLEPLPVRRPPQRDLGPLRAQILQLFAARPTWVRKELRQASGLDEITFFAVQQSLARHALITCPKRGLLRVRHG
jgi:hypothetical protein